MNPRTCSNCGQAIDAKAHYGMGFEYKTKDKDWKLCTKCAVVAQKAAEAALEERRAEF